MSTSGDRQHERERDGVLLESTALVALTPLIPIPFVDDMVRTRLHRRMVQSLANLHTLRLWPDEVKVLADPPSALLAGLARGAVLYPLKRILRKALVVLRFKSMVDHASDTYHRGVLLDHAFASGLCAPVGPYTPAELREAIEAVCRQVPVAGSPVTEAVRAGLSRSGDALSSAAGALRDRFSDNEPTDDEERIVYAVDEHEQTSEVRGIVEQLRHALDTAPREHLESLRGRLTERLPRH